jgi:glutaredoxin
MKQFLKFFGFMILALGCTFSLLVMANPAFQASNIKSKAEQGRANNECATSVVMYSLSYCPACNWQRNQLRQHNIEFTELFADKNPEYKHELDRKAREAGLRSYGYPTLEVGDKLLVNPPIEELRKYLCP